MNLNDRLVFVVDDDDAVRDALGMLFRTAGLAVETYASAQAFLERARPPARSCLVLDVRMPGMDGASLQDELRTRGVRVPIVFITGHGSVPMAVAAMKKGAYDFVEKPFDHEQLLGRVLEALDDAGGAVRASPDVKARLARLSRREREVLSLVLAGKPSRQVATDLAISVKTVEFHRARIMQKVGVRSAAELFRACLAG